MIELKIKQSEINSVAWSTVLGLAGQHLDFLQKKFGFIKNNPPKLIRDISQGIQDILGLHTTDLFFKRLTYFSLSKNKYK